MTRRQITVAFDVTFEDSFGVAAEWVASELGRRVVTAAGRIPGVLSVDGATTISTQEPRP